MLKYHYSCHAEWPIAIPGCQLNGWASSTEALLYIKKKGNILNQAGVTQIKIYSWKIAAQKHSRWKKQEAGINEKGRKDNKERIIEDGAGLVCSAHLCALKPVNALSWHNKNKHPSESHVRVTKSETFKLKIKINRSGRERSHLLLYVMERNWWP